MRADPGFPTYSTCNELLDDEQFAYLVETGRFAGDRQVEHLQR